MEWLYTCTYTDTHTHICEVYTGIHEINMYIYEIYVMTFYNALASLLVANRLYER